MIKLHEKVQHFLKNKINYTLLFIFPPILILGPKCNLEVKISVDLHLFTCFSVLF